MKKESKYKDDPKRLNVFELEDHHYIPVTEGNNIVVGYLNIRELVDYLKFKFPN